MRYVAFRMIEDDTALASFFNHIMTILGPMRLFCAPDSFARSEEVGDFQDSKFCDFCRYEIWMHAVVERLTAWQDTIGAYFTEFHGKWRYYAASQRIASIRKLYGDGDMDDYTDTHIKGENDEDYMQFTVLTDLFDDEWRDIVQDTSVEDIHGLLADIVAIAQVDILEGLKKHFGNTIQPYVQTDDGDVRPMTQEEHDLGNVSRQVGSDDDVKRLKAIAGCIQTVLFMFRRCRYNEDNTELLQMAADTTGALLDMDFKTLGAVIQKFRDEYVKEDEA